MHNAERVFQACVLVASEAHVGESVDTPVVSLPPLTETMQSVRRLASCVCIANALSSVETGSGVYVALDTNHKQALRDVANLLEGVCESLTRAGVVAVPFSEICMCVACVQ
jgi:hypothetical protein